MKRTLSPRKDSLYNSCTTKWISANREGLRYREHENKTKGVGRSKRPLRYYVAVYKWRDKTVTDVYGWEGKDFQDEDAIARKAIELRQNRKNLTPPFTLREDLDLRKIALEAKEKSENEKKQLVQQEELTKINNVFTSYCEANAHKKSLKDEANYFKNWISPYIGNKKLGEVVLLDLERIRRKMTAEGNAPRSIQYIKSIVRQLYHFASAHKFYSGDPPTVNFLKTTKSDNRRQRFLSLTEGEDLLNQVRKYSEKTYQISLLSLHTAMRFGEIANLLWQHINIDNREILVIDPKNGETRAVYMTDRVLEMFSGMPKGRPDELLFPSSGGGKRPRVSKVFFKAIDDLGLNEGITDRRMQVVFHSLRHSCASILVNSGVEIPVIAKILGHKTLAMTMRYSHINDRSVRNAMSVLDGQQTESKVIPIKENLRNLA